MKNEFDDEMKELNEVDDGSCKQQKMEAANNFHKTLLNMLKGKFNDYNMFCD